MAPPYGPPAVVGSHPLSVVPEPLGVPDGVIVDVAQHLMPDTAARWIQDAVLDQQGLLRARGKLSEEFYMATGPASSSCRGLASVLSPATNAYRIGLLQTASGVGQLRVSDMNGGGGTLADLTVGGNASDIVDIKPALGGGVLIGQSSNYGRTIFTGRSSLTLWKGAGKATISSLGGAGTITITQSSPTVTGAGTAWLTTAEPGMFLFGSAEGDLTGNNTQTFLGVVKVVNSNTSITLEQNVLSASAAGINYILTSRRGVASVPWVAKGRITTSNASVIVNGGKTKFLQQGIVGASGWYLFAVDGQKIIYLGSPVAVQSDTQLTLAANALASYSNVKFLAIRNLQSYIMTLPNSSEKPGGFLHAYWNGYQFLANQDAVTGGVDETSRIKVCDPVAIDAVDLTKDGDTFDMPVTEGSFPLTALQPTETGVLACREKETYIIQGTSPADFRLNKLMDDGCYAPMTMVSYQGGAVWAGRKGIYLWDGSQLTNLLDGRAAKYWVRALGAQNSESYKAWAMIEQDHYIVTVSYESGAVGPHPDSKIALRNGVGTNPLELQWVINLKTGALAFWTNVALRGKAYTPGISGTTYSDQTLVVNITSPSTTSKAYNAGKLFTPANLITTADDFACAGLTKGPSFYVETKLYDMGDPERKKLWKQFQMWHKLTGSDLTVEVFTGLDKAASVVATTPFVAAAAPGTYKNKRVKFLKRSTHLGVRLYTPESTGLAGSQMGPWGIGFKLQRPGRV